MQKLDLLRQFWLEKAATSRFCSNTDIDRFEELISFGLYGLEKVNLGSADDNNENGNGDVVVWLAEIEVAVFTVVAPFCLAIVFYVTEFHDADKEKETGDHHEDHGAKGAPPNVLYIV